MMDSSTQGHMKQILTVLIGGFLSLLLWLPATPAHAYDNPELLPEEATSIIDLANSLTTRQEEELNLELEQFEAETGWKLRVLTQYDRTPGRAVKDFWGLNDYSVMLVADPRGGNLLNFSVGDAMRRSHETAIAAPPPVHAPVMAAMVGILIRIAQGSTTEPERRRALRSGQEW